MSSEGFLIRFLLGFAASMGVLSLLFGSGFTPVEADGAAPVIAGRSTQSRLEPRFSRVASTLAGKRVEIRCWSRSGWPGLMRHESAYTRERLTSATLGLAAIGGTRINLSPTVCSALVDLVERHHQSLHELGQLRRAAALVTLAHEPQHSKGIADEAVAECNAIQLAPKAAADLGVSSTYATSLIRTYWLHYGDELPAYRSTECRRGGALDLQRGESIWR